MYKSKNHLERILEIDKKIRSDRFPTKKELSERFEVSKKSIERDFSYMRDRLNAPIEYNAKHKGYYYTDKSFFLPGNMFTEGELLSLILSNKVISTAGSSPLQEQMTISLDKLASYLPDKINTEYHNILSKLTIISDASIPIDKKVWKSILEALRNNYKIIFQYKSPYKKQFERKILNPYHIVSYRGLWYLIGLNPEKQRIENYSISRMNNLSVTNTTFLYPTYFNINEYIDPEMGMYVSTEKYKVKIHFLSWTAPYIKERIWHRTQRISRNNDGSIYLEFTTNQLQQTAQWIMSWGDGAIVITPNELREEILRNIISMKKNYTSLKN